MWLNQVSSKVSCTQVIQHQEHWGINWHSHRHNQHHLYLMLKAKCCMHSKGFASWCPPHTYRSRIDADPDRLRNPDNSALQASEHEYTDTAQNVNKDCTLCLHTSNATLPNYILSLDSILQLICNCKHTKPAYSHNTCVQLYVTTWLFHLSKG